MSSVHPNWGPKRGVCYFCGGEIAPYDSKFVNRADGRYCCVMSRTTEMNDVYKPSECPKKINDELKDWDYYTDG